MLAIHPLFLEITEWGVTLRRALWKKGIAVDDVSNVQIDMQTVESQFKVQSMHVASSRKEWFWIQIDGASGRRIRVKVPASAPSQVRLWARYAGFGTRLNELEDKVRVHKSGVGSDDVFNLLE